MGGAAAALETVFVSAFHLALWGFAMVGLWKIMDRKIRFQLLLILLSIILLCAPYLPAVTGTIGHAQYAAPLIPLLAIMAAAGVCALSDKHHPQLERCEPNV